jgi:hypothetical protein
MFAARAPKVVSGSEDAAFQTGVSFAGHAEVLPLAAANIIGFTSLKKQCINNGPEQPTFGNPSENCKTGVQDGKLCFDFNIV